VHVSGRYEGLWRHACIASINGRRLLAYARKVKSREVKSKAEAVEVQCRMSKI